MFYIGVEFAQSQGANETTVNINKRNVITHNVNWANQKTESFVYRWLIAHALCDVTCFPAFVKLRTSFQTFCQYFNVLITKHCLDASYLLKKQKSYI